MAYLKEIFGDQFTAGELLQLARDVQAERDELGLPHDNEMERAINELTHRAAWA